MKKLLFIVLVCFFHTAWNWKDFSLKIEPRPELGIKTEWVVDTVKQGGLRLDLVNNSPPLVQAELVVQGNAIDGIKAYNKKNGKLVWDFSIPSGVVSPLVLYKGNIYFGGADGFFYSLQLKSGLLNWKYFSASENTSSALIHEDKIYWLASNQKLYALDIKGSLLWIYSGPSSKEGFFLHGGARPALYKNTLYVGFQNGSLLALNRKTGQLQWKRSFSQPIVEDLKISGKCLLVPVFDSHLFCLNRGNGKTLWKLQGGSAVQHREPFDIYQFHKGQLYAFKNRKLEWKKKFESYPFPPSLFKNYLIYGFPSKGELMILQAKEGHYVEKHKFGKGLAGPAVIQGEDLYFLSVSSYLHKLKLKAK
ncbi:MAG: PQQ-like beta-propeller repeat protein [Oligoflexia bacterium]|nr:PQQ-like beta-propeller repeat protein [Oligoflexia bacterium]